MDIKLIILFGFILLIKIYFTNEIPIGGIPPEDFDCPLPNKNIYGNALFGNEAIEWEQKRKFWLTMDIYSKSLNECVNQCYGYRFCYSILFLSTNSIRKTCRLFLHSSDECNGKILLTINKIEKISLEKNKKQIVVECLKCRKVENNEENNNNLISGPENAPKGFKKLLTSSGDQQQQIKRNDDPLKNSKENIAEANKAIISPKNQGVKNAATENFDDESVALRKQRQIWRACLVTFEIFPENEMEKALTNFKLSKTASVSSLNECAFICYQNACSNVLFELGPGGEESVEGNGVRLSKCHLDMESNKETCNGNLQRHYSYPNINMTLMSCVRCVSKKPTTISPFAEIVLRSTASTPTIQQILNTTNNLLNTEQTYKTLNLSENEVTTPINPSLIIENQSKEEENKQLLNNSTTSSSNTTTTIILEDEITQTSQSLFQKEIIQDETDQFKNSTIIEAKGLAAIDTKINRIINKTLEEETTTTTKEGEEEEEETTPAEEEINLLPIKIINEHEDENGSSTRPKSVGLAVPNRQKQIEEKEELTTTKNIFISTSTVKEEEKHLIIGSINSPENKEIETSTNEEETNKYNEFTTITTIIPNETTLEETKEEFGGIFNEKITKNPLEEQITSLIPLTKIENKIEKENITSSQEENEKEELIPVGGIVNENNETIQLISSTNSQPGFGPKKEEISNIIIGNVKINSNKTNEETSTISEINESTYSLINEQKSNIEGEGFIGEKGEEEEENISTTKIPETENKIFGIEQESNNETITKLNELINSTTIFTTTTKININEFNINKPKQESEIKEENSEIKLNETKIEKEVSPEIYETNTTIINEINTSTEKEVIGIENEKTSSEISIEENTNEEIITEINESTTTILINKEGIIESKINSDNTENYENTTITSISSTTKEEIIVGVIPFENIKKEVETNTTEAINPELEIIKIKEEEIPTNISLEINTTTPEIYETNITTTNETKEKEIFGIINKEEKEVSQENPENATTPETSFNTENELLENEANITEITLTTISNNEKEKFGAIAGALGILVASELNFTTPKSINETEATTQSGIEIKGAINSLNETETTEIPLTLTTISNNFETTNEEGIIAAMHETEVETSEKGLENTTIVEEISTPENETIVGFEANITTTNENYEVNITTTESTALLTEETETEGIIGGIHEEEEKELSSEILEINESNTTISIILESTTPKFEESTTVKESLAIFGLENEGITSETNITTPSTYEANTTITGFSTEAITSTKPENETKENLFLGIPFGSEKEKFEGDNSTTTEAIFEITTGSTNKFEEIIESTQNISEIPQINATTPETYEANITDTMVGITEISSTTKEDLFVGVIPFEGEKEVSSNTTNPEVIFKEIETTLSTLNVNESNNNILFETTMGNGNETEEEGGGIIGAAQASKLNNESNPQLIEFEIEGVIRKINETEKIKEELPINELNNNNTTPNTLLENEEKGILPGVILGNEAISEKGNITETTTIAIEESTKEIEKEEVSKVFEGISEENITTSVIEANITTTPETEAIGLFGLKPEEEKEVSETFGELNNTIELTTPIEGGFETNITTKAENEEKILGINNFEINSTIASTTTEAENEINKTFTTTEESINIVVLGPSELFGGATENATIKSLENETEINIFETTTTINYLNETEEILNELNISTTTTTKENKEEEEIFGIIHLNKGIEEEERNNTTEIINKTEIKLTTTIKLEEEELTTTTTIINNNENITEEIPELINAVSKIVEIKKLEVTEPTITAITKLIDFVENNNGTNTLGDIKQHNLLKDFENLECNGEILFTGEILTDYTQLFEIIIASETVYECVKTCFSLNCTRAAFTHFPRSACLLHFNQNELKLEEKCENETEKFVSNWNFKQIPEVVSIKCIKCKEEKELNERILRDQFSLDNLRKLLNEEQHYLHNNNIIINPQGVTNKCSGRVEFNIHPVPELHLLDITNDVPADTAADCAKKCFEMPNCLTAGFIPTPGHESAGGVCLLTKNTEIINNCTNNNQLIHLTPQYASTVPFLINCIKCTECNYSLTISDSKRVFIDTTNSIQTKTINECAIKCSENKCSLAKFDPNKLTCSFAVPDKLPLPPAELGCPIESGLQTDGIFEILLNCVKCNKLIN